jgi:hypothetical protein
LKQRQMIAPSGVSKSMLASHQDSFDREMAALAKPFSDIMQELLTRYTTSAIKRALMNDIARLCVFFGQQRANDLLLPLVITFLNDHDWRLRESFFHNLVGVASFVGRHSLETFILPCIQQALLDKEEFVVDQTIAALACLCELGLFKNHTMIDLCEKCLPMLLHPNVWIRYGVIGVVDALATQLGAAQVYCFVLPLLRPFLVHDIIYITKNTVLQSVLPPVSRASLSKAKLIYAGLSESASTSPKTDSGRGMDMHFAMQLTESGIPQVDQKKLLLMEPYIAACCRNSGGFDDYDDSSDGGAPAQQEKFLQMRFPVRSAPGTPGGAVTPTGPLAVSRRLSFAPGVAGQTLTTVHQTPSIPRVVVHEGWHEVFSASVPTASPATAAATAATAPSIEEPG